MPAAQPSDTPQTSEKASPSQLHPTSSWEKFYADIAHLNESEYGDFKRKAGFYLNELAERLPKDPACRRELQMRFSELWLNPTQEIPARQNALLEWARSKINAQR